MSLSVGVRLGPFWLDERLGSGGIATVYRARHVALKGHVAVKVLNEFFSKDASCRERFQRTARSAALLNHPNVVNVFDFAQEDRATYLAMELVPGGNLGDRLNTPMRTGAVLQILEPIAQALDHAHARGVLHLSIKPSNILFRSDGTPALADFGFATIASVVGADPPSPRTFIGSTEYLSPEQVSGSPLGPASDIYSLAVLCREMLAGLVPFRTGRSGRGFVAVNDPLDKAVAAATKLPDGVNDVLTRAQAADPDDRYQSASQFVAALRPAAISSSRA